MVIGLAKYFYIIILFLQLNIAQHTPSTERGDPNYRRNTDIDVNSICGKIYKKKQEFDGAKIILKQKINCKIHTDKHSKIKLAY